MNLDRLRSLFDSIPGMTADDFERDICGEVRPSLPPSPKSHRLPFIVMPRRRWRMATRAPSCAAPRRAADVVGTGGARPRRAGRPPGSAGRGPPTTSGEAFHLHVRERLVLMTVQAQLTKLAYGVERPDLVMQPPGRPRRRGRDRGGRRPLAGRADGRGSASGGVRPAPRLPRAQRGERRRATRGGRMPRPVERRGRGWRPVPTRPTAPGTGGDGGRRPPGGHRRAGRARCRRASAPRPAGTARPRCAPCRPTSSARPASSWRSTAVGRRPGPSARASSRRREARRRRRRLLPHHRRAAGAAPRRRPGPGAVPSASAGRSTAG